MKEATLVLQHLPLIVDECPLNSELCLSYTSVLATQSPVSSPVSVKSKEFGQGWVGMTHNGSLDQAENMVIPSLLQRR